MVGGGDRDRDPPNDRGRRPRSQSSNACRMPPTSPGDTVHSVMTARASSRSRGVGVVACSSRLVATSRSSSPRHGVSHGAKRTRCCPPRHVTTVRPDSTIRSPPPLPLTTVRPGSSAWQSPPLLRYPPRSRRFVPTPPRDNTNPSPLAPRTERMMSSARSGARARGRARRRRAPRLARVARGRRRARGRSRRKGRRGGCVVRARGVRQRVGARRARVGRRRSIRPGLARAGDAAARDHREPQPRRWQRRRRRGRGGV